MTYYTPEKVNELIQPGFASLLNRVRAEAIRECVNKLCVSGLDMDWLEIRAYLRDYADAIEQNSEGNET